MSNLNRCYPLASSFAVLVALSFPLSAGVPNKSEEQPTRMTMPLVAPVFIEDQNHESVLRMVNELKATVHATVIATAPDGSAIAQQVITFPPHTEQILKLRDLLKRSGMEQATGSVQVIPNPMEVQSMAIAAQLSITDNRSSPPSYLEEELLSPDPSMPSDYRIAVPALRSPVVALLSTSAKPQSVNITCLHSAAPETVRTLELQPEHLVITPACVASSGPTPALSAMFDEETPGSTDRSEAMAIEVSGAPGTFAAWGAASTDSRQTRTRLSLNFINAAALRSPDMIFAGVPVGPTELLDNEDLHPEIAIANFSSAQAHVSVLYSTMAGGEPETRSIPVAPVAPGAAEALPLPELDGDPHMLNSFVVSSDGKPGQVISNMISRGQGSYRAIQLIGKDREDVNNGGAHPWSIADRDTSTVLLFNHTDKPTTFNLNIGAPGVIWHQEYQLLAKETRALDMAEIVREQFPDVQGHTLPATMTAGEVSWFTPDHGNGTGRLIVSNAQAGLARNFSCGSNIVLCGAGLYDSFAGLVLGFDGFLGAVYGNFCTAYDPNACSGQQYGTGGGSSYLWRPSNSGISPVSGANNNSSATFYGNSVGSAYGMGAIYTSTCGASSSGDTSVTSFTQSQHTYPNSPLPNGCRVSTCFDCIINQTTKAKHRAQDVVGTNLQVGTPVYAAEGGTVIAALGSATHVNQPISSCAGKGYAANYVKIQSGTSPNIIVTRYVHVTPTVSQGTSVSAGQQIGTVDISGCTSGPHVHMASALNGAVINFTIPCDNSHFDGADTWYDDPTNFRRNWFNHSRRARASTCVSRISS